MFSIELNRRNPPPLLIPVLYQHLSTILSSPVDHLLILDILSTILSSPQTTGEEFQASMVGVSGFCRHPPRCPDTLTEILQAVGDLGIAGGSWVVHLTRRGCLFVYPTFWYKKTVRTALHLQN